MLLKNLQLQGFKSFADKTVIDFHSGVTGIVGPNGCGKSNVVDAVKWVLGETSAKALRGGEMADVIFNGTDKRKPHAMAEVTLTFSDCEEALGVAYNEISLTRRVYRDGKGEYAMNGAPCRLRDFNELFMDTGIGQSAYSIMEQGKIDQLLSSKPEDRRAVFEEAAGITKFKTQKREALRKLEYTEANLLRVTDIIAELRRQMGSMQRQAAKARRYQEIHQEVRILDTHLSHRRWREWMAEKSELETSMASLNAESNRLVATIASHEGEVESLRRELERTDAALALLHSQINEQRARMQGARNRIDFNGERQRELAGLIDANLAEIESTSGRMSAQEYEIKSAEETLASIESNVGRQESQIADHAARARRHRENREQIERDLRDVRRFSNQSETSIISSNAHLANHEAQIASDGRRHEQLEGEIEKLESDRTERTAEEGRLVAELAVLAGRRESQERQLADAQDGLRQTQTDLDAAQRQLRQAHQSLDARRSRLEILEQLVAKGEGLESGTRQVLHGLNHPNIAPDHVRGVLSSYLEVEPEYVRAIESALGHHLQAVLVADTAVAEAIVAVLTGERQGEAVILPENFIPRELPRQLSTLPEGSLSWAADRVRVRAPVGPIIDHLLGHVLVVPDLATALRLRQSLPELGFATLAGEFLSAQGMIRGGRSTEEPTSMLQRQNEIRRLTVEVEEWGGRVEMSEAGVATMSGMALAIQEQLTGIAQDLHRTRLLESSLQGQLGSIRKELASSQNRVESLRWERSEVAKRRESLTLAMASLHAALDQARRELEAHAARAGELDQALANAARQEADSAELLNEMKTALAVEHRAAESLRHQRHPMMNRLHDLGALIERREAEIASYRERIGAADEENDRLRAEIAQSENDTSALESSIAGEQSKRAGQAQSVATLERELSVARRQSAIVAEQRGREEVKVTQIGLRLENLENYISERYHTTLAGFETDVHTLAATLAAVRARRAAAEKRRATMAGRGEDAAETSADDPPADRSDPSGDDPLVSAASNELPPDPDGLIDPAAAFDWTEVELLAAELKQRLDSMGPVNLDAIQEYEELEERFQFLEREHGDLVNSKSELLSIIQKINLETRRMFAETFERVRLNFQKTFRELFGTGASSNLVLVNEDDPLESGIEIIAKPPGKKPQTISLLSGGERSMTAVALLFSIYMVKPAPFCVLDELDAPLDEANIGRFLRMLDQFIDKSQFVIVTHNKNTMRRADVLYGITMEEFGVSKPVGMKMNRGEPETGIHDDGSKTASV